MGRTNGLSGGQMGSREVVVKFVDADAGGLLHLFSGQ